MRPRTLVRSSTESVSLRPAGLPSASVALTVTSNVSPATYTGRIVSRLIENPWAERKKLTAVWRFRSGSVTASGSVCVSLNSRVGSLNVTSPLASVVASCTRSSASW